MHESLVRLTNILTELSADSLLSEARLASMVTLMVEKFFSLLRKEDSMPNQLEYGIRRTSCVRELVKRMYRGQVSYFTGPKSYYPDKVIDACPLTNIEEVQQEFAKLCLEDKKQLREFTASYGQSIKKHTVHDKSKENTGCLQYAVSFNEEAREAGSPFSISTLSTLIGKPARQRQEDHPAYSVYFAVDDLVAIKHARKREVLSFFLAVLLKDVLIKETSGNEFEFAEDTVNVLWLNNSDSDDPLAFTEAYRVCKNSPYTIVDKVVVVIEQDTSGKKLYSLSQEEADRIEHRLQGGPENDLESDVDDGTDDENDEERVPYRTRSGRLATRLIL